MQTYKGTYKVRNGEAQEIHFVKMKDLPPKFLEKHRRTRIGDGKRIQIEGLEVVWDLDIRQFRYIDRSAMQGKIEKSNFIVDTDTVLL